MKLTLNFALYSEVEKYTGGSKMSWSENYALSSGLQSPKQGEFVFGEKRQRSSTVSDAYGGWCREWLGGGP